MRTKIYQVKILLFIALAAVSGCSYAAEINSARVTIDAGLDEIRNKADGSKAVAPTHIVSIVLTVEGEGMEKMEESFDPGSGLITLDVPSGKNRVFSLSVECSVTTYSGQATADIEPGEEVALVVDMGQLVYGVSSIAGNHTSSAGAGLSGPSGIVTDGVNLYIADTDNNCIRRIVISTGEASIIAGTVETSGSADGTGDDARFYGVSALTIYDGCLYAADTYNCTIRRIVIATGEVSTIAGTAGTYGSADGTGAAAGFSSPSGITTNGNSLYVSDRATNTIRKIVIGSWEVTTIAGTAGAYGSTDGNGTSARFDGPTDITTDGTSLYVTDSDNNTIRRIVISTNDVSTFAGTANVDGSADGTGSAAGFNYPTGITADGTNLYVTDLRNNTIRCINIATANVTTVAGTAGTMGYTEGAGAAARFYGPSGITAYNGCLYVADTTNNKIRKIVIPGGNVTTFASNSGSDGSGSVDGTGTGALFNYPYGLATDGTSIFVADTSNHAIRKIMISTGVVTTIAGTLGVSGSADGTGTSASFYNPRSVTSDGTSLYVADAYNNVIRKIEISTGTVTTVTTTAASGKTKGVPTPTFSAPGGITTDGENLYVADTGNSIIKKIVISTSVMTTLAGTNQTCGTTDGTGADALFDHPESITTDGSNLYVSDSNNNTIRKIVISTGVVTTVAGTAGVSGSEDGTGAAARFNYPAGIATDGTNLYVADCNNHTIRKIVLASGVVTTILGSSGNADYADGTSGAANFNYPTGITIYGTSIYVTDRGNNTIRKISW